MELIERQELVKNIKASNINSFFFFFLNLSPILNGPLKSLDLKTLVKQIKYQRRQVVGKVLINSIKLKTRTYFDLTSKCVTITFIKYNFGLHFIYNLLEVIRYKLELVIRFLA